MGVASIEGLCGGGAQTRYPGPGRLLGVDGCRQNWTLSLKRPVPKALSTRCFDSPCANTGCSKTQNRQIAAMALIIMGMLQWLSNAYTLRPLTLTVADIVLQ
jgi:hypothetical protein